MSGVDGNQGLNSKNEGTDELSIRRSVFPVFWDIVIPDTTMVDASALHPYKEELTRFPHWSKTVQSRPDPELLKI
jgi:hypothetical protein